MAYHTVEDGPWPRGTTVSVYPTSMVVGGVPTGAPLDTQVADGNGTVTFGGLTEGDSYTAFGHGGTQLFTAVNQESRIRALEQSGGAGPTTGTLPIGGSTGQVLRKESGTNYDAAWAAPDVTQAELDAAIAAEVSTRAAADTAEASTRAAAISSEASTRATADTTEATTRASAVTAEASARTSADTAETNARIAADDALDARLDILEPLVTVLSPGGGTASGSVTINMSGVRRGVYVALLTGNTTLSVTNMAAGAELYLALGQDATGGRVVTWSAPGGIAWYWPGAVEHVLSTTASAFDRILVRGITSTSVDFVTIAKDMRTPGVNPNVFPPAGATWSTGFEETTLSGGSALMPSGNPNTQGFSYPGAGIENRPSVDPLTIVNPTTLGLGFAAHSSNAVLRCRTSAADIAAGNYMAKVYRIWDVNLTPDPVLNNVSGTYTCWYYIPSSYALTAGVEWNIFQFKENWPTPAGQNAQWYLRAFAKSTIVGAGAQVIGSLPASNGDPMASVTHWTNTGGYVQRYMALPKGRWFKVHAVLVQGSKVDFYIDDVLIWTGLQTTYPVGMRDPATQIAWIFGTGHYANSVGDIYIDDMSYVPSAGATI